MLGDAFIKHLNIFIHVQLIEKYKMCKITFNKSRCWADDIYVSPVSLHQGLERDCCVVTVAGTGPENKQAYSYLKRNIQLIWLTVNIKGCNAAIFPTLHYSSHPQLIME